MNDSGPGPRTATAAEDLERMRARQRALKLIDYQSRIEHFTDYCVCAKCLATVDVNCEKRPCWFQAPAIVGLLVKQALLYYLKAQEAELRQFSIHYFNWLCDQRHDGHASDLIHLNNIDKHDLTRLIRAKKPDDEMMAIIDLAQLTLVASWKLDTSMLDRVLRQMNCMTSNSIAAAAASLLINTEDLKEYLSNYRFLLRRIALKLVLFALMEPHQRISIHLMPTFFNNFFVGLAHFFQAGADMSPWFDCLLYNMRITMKALWQYGGTAHFKPEAFVYPIFKSLSKRVEQPTSMLPRLPKYLNCDMCQTKIGRDSKMGRHPWKLFPVEFAWSRNTNFYPREMLRLEREKGERRNQEMPDVIKSRRSIAIVCSAQCLLAMESSKYPKLHLFLTRYKSMDISRLFSGTGSAFALNGKKLHRNKQEKELKECAQLIAFIQPLKLRRLACSDLTVSVPSKDDEKDDEFDLLDFRFGSEHCTALKLSSRDSANVSSDSSSSAAEKKAAKEHEEVMCRMNEVMEIFEAAGSRCIPVVDTQPQVNKFVHDILQDNHVRSPKTQNVAKVNVAYFLEEEDYKTAYEAYDLNMQIFVEFCPAFQPYQPDGINQADTMSTLRYAFRSGRIVTKPTDVVFPYELFRVGFKFVVRARGGKGSKGGNKGALNCLFNHPITWPYTIFTSDFDLRKRHCDGGFLFQSTNETTYGVVLPSQTMFQFLMAGLNQQEFIQLYNKQEHNLVQVRSTASEDIFKRAVLINYVISVLATQKFILRFPNFECIDIIKFVFSMISYHPDPEHENPTLVELNHVVYLFPDEPLSTATGVFARLLGETRSSFDFYLARSDDKEVIKDITGKETLRSLKKRNGNNCSDGMFEFQAVIKNSCSLSDFRMALEKQDVRIMDETSNLCRLTLYVFVKREIRLVQLLVSCYYPLAKIVFEFCKNFKLSQAVQLFYLSRDLLDYEDNGVPLAMKSSVYEVCARFGQTTAALELLVSDNLSAPTKPKADHLQLTSYNLGPRNDTALFKEPHRLVYKGDLRIVADDGTSLMTAIWLTVPLSKMTKENEAMLSMHTRLWSKQLNTSIIESPEFVRAFKDSKVDNDVLSLVATFAPVCDIVRSRHHKEGVSFKVTESSSKLAIVPYFCDNYYTFMVLRYDEQRCAFEMRIFRNEALARQLYHKNTTILSGGLTDATEGVFAFAKAEPLLVTSLLSVSFDGNSSTQFQMSTIRKAFWSEAITSFKPVSSAPPTCSFVPISPKEGDALVSNVLRGCKIMFEPLEQTDFLFKLMEMFVMTGNLEGNVDGRLYCFVLPGSRARLEQWVHKKEVGKLALSIILLEFVHHSKELVGYLPERNQRKKLAQDICDKTIDILYFLPREQEDVVEGESGARKTDSCPVQDGGGNKKPSADSPLKISSTDLKLKLRKSEADFDFDGDTGDLGHLLELSDESLKEQWGRLDALVSAEQEAMVAEAEAEPVSLFRCKVCVKEDLKMMVCKFCQSTRYCSEKCAVADTRSHERECKNSRDAMFHEVLRRERANFMLLDFDTLPSFRT